VTRRGSAGIPRPERLRDGADLARAAAALLAEKAVQSVAQRGIFTLALSGGSTPKALYELLADPSAPFRERIPWPSVLVLFGDERAVPPDHPQSNYRMARQALLDHVSLAGVVRMEGELGAEKAAERCEAEIRRRLGGEGIPALDLVLLGLGTDGHTASLFPDSTALDERVRWVVAAKGPPPLTERITFAPPLLEAARAVLFLVSGKDKAEPLSKLIDPGEGEPRIPAARLMFRGEVRVLADEEARSLLPAADED
jgi:6-phosphogluconolactonase